MSANRGGFTLIEVALAVLIVAMGVMAVFALISGGLAANADAVADTQSALFAEGVFNALQAASEEAAYQQAYMNFYQPTPDLSDTTWRDTWESFQAGTDVILVPASQFWQTTPFTVKCFLGAPGDPPYALCFSNAPQHDVSEAGLVNGALRYKMEVNIWPVTPPTDFSAERAEVTLRVWDGLFGSYRDEDAMVFYSEFDSQGDL